MAASLPIVTARLTLRLMTLQDVPTFVAYRNDPDIARHQLWTLPYTDADAIASLTDQQTWTEIALGRWTTLAVELDGEMIGDVCTNVDATGGVAEIGFTLATAFHGRGYAAEGASALVVALFDRVGVGRVYGELDPVNVASQRVLEACGLVYEYVTRRSFWWRGEWTDNMSYGSTREEFDQWRHRPLGAAGEVTLRALTAGNERAFHELRTHHSQERFVATMAASYADALFPVDDDKNPATPWLQGVYADGEPAGFLMTAAVNDFQSEPFLWRLLVDRRFQRRGIGRQALRLHVEQLRERGYSGLLTSWIEGPGSPRPFYEGIGFKPTGRIIDGETEARLGLD